MKRQIDLERCERAMQNLEVRGAPRPALILEAIQKIQDSPKECFKRTYLGIKNYASFGDQREDHEYGMGPRHGSIVFRIGRKNPSQDIELGADEIYYLECFRDFGTKEFYAYAQWSGKYEKQQLDLGQTILRWRKAEKELSEYVSALNVEVDSILLEFEAA